MGMGLRRQIGHVGTFGHYIANDEVKNPLRGGQDRVGGPQVPILGHGDSIETSNWACRSYW